MYFMPFGMSGGPTTERSPLDELDKTIKFYEAMKKSLKEDSDKDKKKDPPKKTGDIISTAMFFTFFTPVVMLGWFWLMSKMLIDVLETFAKIKGLH